ncbi:MAG: InlB B-repeat-containing protein [Oscillospiraceae bacterium]|nr:InlB B-repeat-containing protein [Oscillospiraceae bacterium]
MKLKKILAMALTVVMVIAAVPASMLTAGARVLNSNIHTIPPGGTEWDIGKYSFNVKADLPDSFADVAGIRIYIGAQSGSNWDIPDGFIGALQWKNGNNNELSENFVFGGFSRPLRANEPDNENAVDFYSDRHTIQWFSFTPLAGLSEFYLSAWWPDFWVTSWQYLDVNGYNVGDMFYAGQRLDIRPFGGNFNLLFRAEGPGAEPGTWDWKMMRWDGNIKGAGNFFEAGVINLDIDANGNTGIWTDRFTSAALGISPFGGSFFPPPQPGDYIEFDYSFSAGWSFNQSGTFTAVYGDGRDRIYIELMDYINDYIDVATATSLDVGAPLINNDKNIATWGSDGMDDVYNGIPVSAFTQAKFLEIQTNGMTLNWDDQLSIVWQSPHSINPEDGGWLWNQSNVRVGDVLRGDVLRIELDRHLANYSEFAKADEEVKILVCKWGDDPDEIGKLGITGAELYRGIPMDYMNFQIESINGKPVFSNHTAPNLGRPDFYVTHSCTFEGQFPCPTVGCSQIGVKEQAVWGSDGTDGISNGIRAESFTSADGMRISVKDMQIDPTNPINEITIVWANNNSWWNQSNIAVNELLQGDDLVINFSEHLHNYSEFIKPASNVKITIARWGDGGVDKLGLQTAELFGGTCSCEANDGVTIDLPILDEDVQIWGNSQINWGVDGMNGVYNGISVQDYRNARGIALKLENTHLFETANNKSIALIWQSSTMEGWGWEQTGIPLSSVMCADGTIRIDFEKYIFRYDDFLNRDDLKIWLGYWDWGNNAINFDDLVILDSYLYGYTEATPVFDYTFDLGENNDFGGASANQWLWASNGTDGIFDSNRLEAWQFKSATGVAFYFDKKPDLDATMHLIWLGDGGNWNWSQFDVPVADVYNKTENAVFIDLERYINNYAAFSGSNSLKLGIAYWETDLYELGIKDAFLYGTNTIYKEYTQNLLIGRGGWNGAMLYEGNYNPYGLDFSDVKQVRFTFNVTNSDELGEDADVAIVLNLGADFDGMEWQSRAWQQEFIPVASLIENNVYTVDIPEDFIKKNNDGLGWFQAGVASWSGADGYYSIDLLDKDGEVINLIRQAQVVFAAHETTDLGNTNWVSFNNKRPQGRAQTMNFTGATVDKPGTYTVRINDFGLQTDHEGNFYYFGVNVGESINLNEYYLEDISVKIDGAAITVKKDEVYLSPDWNEIVILNTWWYDSQGKQNDYAINPVSNYPIDSVEITFTLKKYADMDGFAGYDITYNLNGGTNPANAPAKYNGAVALPIPTRAGFTFGGWYTVETFASTSLVSTTASQVGTLNLYARWFAQTGARYTVSNASTSNSRVFTVNVAVSDNMGIALLRNSLIFDNNAFELISLELNSNFTPGVLTRSGLSTSPVTLLWDSGADNSRSGTFATLSFRVKSNAPSGDYVIAVSHGNAVKYNLSRETFEGGAAVISVAANNTPFKLGDINGDGEVGMTDLPLLRMHIAGLITLDGSSLAAAKVNDDMDIALMMLRRYIVGELATLNA